MYNMMTVNNKTVLYIWNLLIEKILKVLITRKKFVNLYFFICGDGY